MFIGWTTAIILMTTHDTWTDVHREYYTSTYSSDDSLGDDGLRIHGQMAIISTKSIYSSGELTGISLARRTAIVRITSLPTLQMDYYMKTSNY